MVIFHHGDAAEGKGEEERGGTIHKGISQGRRSFATKMSLGDDASMEEKKEGEK